MKIILSSLVILAASPVLACEIAPCNMYTISPSLSSYNSTVQTNLQKIETEEVMCRLSKFTVDSNGIQSTTQTIKALDGEYKSNDSLALGHLNYSFTMKYSEGSFDQKDSVSVTIYENNQTQSYFRQINTEINGNDKIFNKVITNDSGKEILELTCKEISS